MKRRQATRAEIDQARKMRAGGATLQQIADTLGFGRPWVSKTTSSAKRKSRPVTDIEKRARNLIRRGFDVPPSKQADWVRLTRAGITAPERVKMLGLE